ncbi:DNA-directed RNA polymerase [Aminobacter sp. HY435]|uniref:DNA-directed RNA polymerase n=1 Tax=Aminobacter sp. HY435 TaxID=2970917 RepID=UPI0022B98E01|nr:DNA-directed RNA polymerase [Aminobacter sp. HY435]
MPNVFNAIHLLQETAWQVNTRVLDVAVAVWAKAGDASVAGLPQIDEKQLPARTPRMAEHAEASRRAREQGLPKPARDEQTDKEILAWKRKAAPVYRFNAKRLSKMRATSTTILIAQEYARFPSIYFPHMLDFRGRIYPIANFLQPQGSDLARGLLTFAEGLPITEENGGAGWLAIQLASACGVDKVAMGDRIEWVEAHEEQWRRIAADPYTNTEWQKADKPFQALAAIFEWVEFLGEGYGYISHLPVMVDGTCNGIQHLSAILRDEVAGRYVNLVPADKPQDIYKVVATGAPAVPEETETDRIAQEAVLGLQHTLERIERAGGAEGEKATYWLELCERNLPRTLTKRQVMVLPYGGTKDSFFTYTRKWLDEYAPAPEPTDDEFPSAAQVAEFEANGVTLIDGEEKPRKLDDLLGDLRTKRVVFLAAHLWDTVNEVVKSGMKVMKWLQDCSKAVAVANQPIYWTVPSGFVVRHFYGLDRSIVHKIMLDGERVEVTRNEKTAQLSTREQTQGIAPNFIHSLDASCLVECIKRCREAGIEEFVSVHDAYGTHAANMGALSVFLREAFVATHEVDVLANFRADCQRVLVDWLVVEEGLDPLAASEKADGMLPEPLAKGSLDLRLVLESDYFFA